DLKRIFEKDFAVMDKNGDKVIDRNELESALNDRNFDGEDAQMAAALRNNMESFQELSASKSGITSDGIEKFDKIQREIKAQSPWHFNWSRSNLNLVKDVDWDMKFVSAVGRTNLDPMGSLNFRSSAAPDMNVRAALSERWNRPETTPQERQRLRFIYNNLDT